MKRDFVTDWRIWVVTTTWGTLPLWLALAALAGGAYLLAAAVGYGVTGFPLDDAWIHQTYARNLALTGQWAFVPGQTSAGSTSPLWSLLLSLGYWLGIPYLIWSYGLGILALGLTGWSVARLGVTLFPDKPWVGPLAGLFCVLEWHMGWAAVSGMETTLYIWLSVVLAKWQVSNPKSPRPVGQDRQISNLKSHLRFAILGFVGGLLTLTRPEGLGLVGLIGLAIGWQLRRMPVRLLRAWAALGVGLALPLVPYLAFHYTTTGLPFPNTFYAKQQEYRVLLTLYPLWRRWLMMAGITLVGGQILLLPGFVYSLWRSLPNRQLPTSNLQPPTSPSPRGGPSWLAPAGQGAGAGNLQSPTPGPQPPAPSPQPPAPSLLLPVAWCFVHLSLYALRLPVTYQHGRYQMPVIPFFILLGVGGMAHLLRPNARTLLPRILSRAAIAATVLVGLAFLGLGARAYATDVAFIQGEMVATARWLEDHTPPGSLVAVHDIGAVGYFTTRPLLDLAGLVTPEVIPFIADEARLIELMQARGANYAVFFPDWSAAYQRMAQDPRLEPAHVTGFKWTLSLGRTNMTVYRVQSR